MEERKRSVKTKWEVSIIEVEDQHGVQYKVTRSIPDLKVAETKMFRSKEEAKRQFDVWLE